MPFRKFLLNDGLMLIIIITITLSIANNTEYEQIANKTEYEQIANNTEYEQVANKTKYEQIANNTEYEQIANNTEYDTEYTAIDYNSVTVPFHYNVKILLYFKDNLLFGDCSINININRQIKSIKLNSVPISIIEAILIDSNNTSVYKFSTFTNYNNILTINFDKKISPDTYTLNVTYMRTIHKDENSFDVYQDKLEDLMLKKKNYEVMKTRQLFPCKDELTSNSTIKIAIKHDKKYAVLSNIPIQVRNKAANGMMWTDFDETLPMSVQQISVVITTFTNVSSQLANITIWCRQSVQKYVQYAISVLEKVVPHFKENNLMELSKLDIVAFWHPYDYNFTALGLIFLREADIIYNEDLHPVIRQREVAHTIARQLAFLWCNDALLWSKEGFVTFFGAYILDQIYENDHMMDLMVVQAHQDSFRYEIPSTTELNNTTEIISWSPLNYIKSFIIWRMFYHIIPDVFWRGIRTYIDRRFINDTTPDDLWTIMQSLYTENNPKRYPSFYLKHVIDLWSSKKYYFVLYAYKLYYDVRYYDTLVRYIRSPYIIENDKRIYWIPVTYTLQTSVNFNTSGVSHWISTENIARYPGAHTAVSIDHNSSINNWIIINIQQAGYYRVSYTRRNWELLMQYLNSEDYNKIHILNRAQIIDDAFYFFLQRQLSYKLFWNLTNFVIRDVNFVTWYPMIKVFESFTCIFPLEYGNMVTAAMKNRIDQLLTKIGYFEESNDYTPTIYLRQEAVKWACILDISKWQEVAALEVNNELQNSMKTNKLMWKNCHGLRTANYTIWYEIWQKWNATSDERYLEYLTCSEESAYNLLKTLMEQIQPNDNKRIIMRANAFLFTVAKHAKRNRVFSYFIKIFFFEDFKLSPHTHRDHNIIATLIVIITNVHNENQLREIAKHASNYKYQITEAIKKKIKKRRLEYGRLVYNYAYYFS